MNRAVAGDLVVVEVLPESEWKSIGEEVVDEDGAFGPSALLRSYLTKRFSSRSHG